MLDCYYNCTNLTTAVIGPNVVSMCGTFAECVNLTSINYMNCQTVADVNEYTFLNVPSTCKVLIPFNKIKDFCFNDNWSRLSLQPDDEETLAVLSEKENGELIRMTENTTTTLKFFVVNYGDKNITLSATSTDSTLATIGNIAYENINEIIKKITVDVTAGAIIPSSRPILNINISDSNGSISSMEFPIENTLNWEVQPVDGASYGFELNDNGYYESKNKGKGNTAALCKVIILKNPQNANVIFDCINDSENECYYDYGILSKVGKTLYTNTTIDSSSNVQKSFQDIYGSSIIPVSYGAISSGTIYVKYRKDSGGNSGSDTFQFTVRFE
jgi:hypothetical protein